MNATALRDAALDLDDKRLLVPEPVVKEFLRERGLPVPSSAVADTPEALFEASASLHEPLVLKAFGHGILHKSDIGAVRIELAKSDLVKFAGSMDSDVRAAGFAPLGFMVEEQAPRGFELLVGVVVNSGLAMLVCGLGGVFAELLHSFSERLLPITERDAAEMLDELIGEVAEGARSPFDRDVVIDLLVRIAGPDGIAAEMLAVGMTELEFNPVIVSGRSASMVDARLIVQREFVAATEPPPYRDLDPLFKPKTIALSGVSRSGRGMGNMSLAQYRRIGWTDGLYIVRPDVDGSDPGVVASLADVPGGQVDYLKVMVPASQVVDLLKKEGPRTRSVQLITAGFGEAGAEGADAEAELVSVMHELGVPLIGPNCLGTYCPAGRQTINAESDPIPGTVGVVSQSGGVSNEVIFDGASRGVTFSKVVSVGNAIDVSAAEVVEYLVNDPDTQVVGAYMEHLSDAPRLVRALRQARGVKPVVLLIAGLTKSGALAASSHTGAMASDNRLVEAIGTGTGVELVTTLEALNGALLALECHRDHVAGADGSTLLVVGHGGGNTVLAGDMAERAGLSTPSFAPDVVARVSEFPSELVKSTVNPLEVMIGPIFPAESTREVVEGILERQAFSDVLVHCSARAFYKASEAMAVEEGGFDLLLARMESLARPLPNGARVYLLVRTPDVITPADRERLVETSRRTQIPVFYDLELAVKSIGAVQRFHANRSATAS
jgi:acyl-CoA synthetase (NDP forming)